MLFYYLFPTFLGKSLLFHTYHAFSSVFPYKYGNTNIIIYAKVYPSDFHSEHVLLCSSFIIKNFKPDDLSILKTKITLDSIRQHQIHSGQQGQETRTKSELSSTETKEKSL